MFQTVLDFFVNVPDLAREIVPNRRLDGWGQRLEVCTRGSRLGGLRIQAIGKNAANRRIEYRRSETITWS
jgi:hypothetical protein